MPHLRRLLRDVRTLRSHSRAVRALAPAEQVVTPSGHYGSAQDQLERNVFTVLRMLPLLPLNLMTTLNQSEWITRLRSIVKSSDRSQWELGDALSQGETAFGRRPCYDLAQTATGWHRLSLYRIAGVASYFPKPLRFENLSWSVYVLLRPFPLSFLEQFIPTIADSGLSGKLIRERACAEYGSDPQEWRKQKKYRTVRISTSLLDKIVEKSGTAKVTALVTEILESWLIGSPVERQPASGNKTREWNQKVKDAGNEPVEAEKAPVGSSESDVPAPAATQPCPPNPSPTETPKPVEVDLSEPEPQTRRSPQDYLDDDREGLHRLTDRPTYSQRRAQQIADGAEPISKRVGKQMRRTKPHALRLQWVPCGRQVDAGNGPAMARARSQKPDCFRTPEDARTAEEKNFQEKGHREGVVYCVVPCGAFHVKHVYSSEVLQRKSAPLSQGA